MHRLPKKVIVALIAVEVIAGVPPSSWRDAEDAMRRHLGSIKAMARPVAERSTNRFEMQTHAFRDWLGEVEFGSGTVVQIRQNEAVRIARADRMVTGSGRVIDGDTLDVGGVRISLHGIDASENGQSCRAGGKRWSCGRVTARAIAVRIGGRSVACQERDRDRYGRVVAMCSTSGMVLNAWMVADG